MKKVVLGLIVLIFIGIPAYIFTSDTFEQEVPKIELKNSTYWNLSSPLKVNIQDDSGIRYYKVTLLAGNKAHILKKEEKAKGNKEISLDLKLPIDFPLDVKEVKVIVEAVDTSKWNFFAGNENKETFSLILDTKMPQVEIINNSYAIKRGGSAVAIVRLSDEHLTDYYVEINKKTRYKLTPFFKEGYFITLLAWPVEEENFSAYVHAIDKAGNHSRFKIPFYWRKFFSKKETFTITDKFVKNKSATVLNQMRMTIPNDTVSIFKKTNEELRAINEKALYEAANRIDEKSVDDFSVARLLPLKGASKRANFGDFREYLHNDEQIGYAWHKGLDVASFKRAKIYSNNDGKVIYAKYTGIYGNTLLIYHALGFVTGYSHCSMFKVNEGDDVSREQTIALTGNTGAVFGDHLHFSVMIQGIPVNPIEWMDKTWIKTNITDVIASSKRMINR